MMITVLCEFSLASNRFIPLPKFILGRSRRGRRLIETTLLSCPLTHEGTSVPRLHQRYGEVKEELLAKGG